MMITEHYYTTKQQVSSSISHGIGAGLSIAALSILIVMSARQGDAWRIVSFSIYDSTLVILYVAMGWIIVIAIKPLLVNLPRAGLVWLGLGGVCYTAGLLFYAWGKLSSGHFIWHLFVLGGSIFLFFGILLYVLPMK